MKKPYKAVIFDLGGVILEAPQNHFLKYVKNIRMPYSFLTELFTKKNGSFEKLEKGELTLTEFYPRFDFEVNQLAKENKVNFNNSFSAEKLFSSIKPLNEISWFEEKNGVRHSMLEAISILRSNGFKICALTNNWIDDCPSSNFYSAVLFTNLKQYFDIFIESARINMRKPDINVFQHALNKLGTSPAETVFLDDLGINLKTAKSLGIKCIKVKNEPEALASLEEVVGVKLVKNRNYYPPPCVPDKVSHSFIKVSPDIKLHFVEMGQGPTVILLHGFPDCWYGYRHQIPALACAGFRVIAVDQRGYGQSSSPSEVEEYTQKKLCQDIINLMDQILISKATVVGHDWGASVAWNLALMYPERFSGVCGVCNPFYPVNSKRDPLQSILRNPGVFDYMLYFQEKGIAETELNVDIERSLNCILRGFNETINNNFDTSNVRKNKGILKQFPKHLKISTFLTPKELGYYTSQFKKNGFEGPLNWYRNLVENWHWRCTVKDRKIAVPSLMITAENDPILKPEFSFGMEKIINNLERCHIEKCGHWVMQEKPKEFNDCLIGWLRKISTYSKL